MRLQTLFGTVEYICPFLETKKITCLASFKRVYLHEKRLYLRLYSYKGDHGLQSILFISILET